MKIATLDELQEFALATECAECRRDAERLLRVLQSRLFPLGAGFEFDCVHQPERKRA